MKTRTFILITLMILFLALNACGGSQTPPPTTPPTIPGSTFTPVPAGSVAILVLDDFMDEITGDSITSEEYEDIKAKALEESVIEENNCVYTTQGQAAIVGKGAAAIVGEGAGGSEIRLPAPHGVVVFNELREIVNREKTPVSQKSGVQEFGTGWDWISNVDIYDHDDVFLALVGIDVSNYTTLTIASHLEEAVDKLSSIGYSKFVINLSFVIMPCPDLTQTDDQITATFNRYREIIESDPDLQYLDATLTEIQNTSSGVDAIVRLAFNPDLGPVRLRSYYNSPIFNTDIFDQVLNDDPVRSALEALSTSYDSVIPIAASGNDGLYYPYAPAMWDIVLSVGAPIVTSEITGDATTTPIENPRQLSSFVDNTGQIAHFYTNSGEVVAEGCTTYTDTQRIPGTSFAAPKLSYLAALHLLQGGSASCMGSLSVEPVPPLGYAAEDGSWNNESIPTAADEYCSIFPTAEPSPSCP